MGRTAQVERATAETRVCVTLDLDGSGRAEISTGIGFFDHMLRQLAQHGLLDLTVRAQGDLAVDGHHTVEDTGIVLGQALARALGEQTGVARYGTAVVPMDEALVLAALDVGGRAFCACEVAVPTAGIGDFDSQLLPEFLRAFCQHGGVTLHVRQLAGSNGHHIVEAVFKALGRALRAAVRRDARVQGVMSTKGVLGEAASDEE